MIVVDYAAKFEELSRFCTHYNGLEAEGSKCIEFESGLLLQIKQFIDTNGKYRFQPKTVGVKTQSKGGAPTHVKCFKCGVLGHRAPECTALTCYRCGMKPKKTIDTKVQGKLFALSGADASNSDNLIRDISFINGILLVTIIDTSDMHLFIFAECVKRLNLEVSSTNGCMVIDTPANGSVTTIMVCLRCPLTTYDRDFMIDLVCLPLNQLNIILGMNWLIFNHIYIKYYNKSVLFQEFVIEEDSMFISASYVEKFL
ncbi:uncharacterized protein LOC127102799 [Lathyrus oleraceus]|uniref:uncharacterized protein LOC127102799 n=1 Tax=Pisum sativum TaxID=3888 RepID=UPI0021D2E076|nr:uncharacterized protein LOC127102799 [Pisum sativum]